MKRFLPFLILIFLVNVIGFATYNLNKQQDFEKKNKSPNSDDNFSVHFEKEKIVLPEFSFPNLFNEKEDFSKQNLIGKYSLINFFASWCSTCKSEHEVLLRLQRENIVDIYGIAWRDIDENTKNYLKKSGNPYKLIATDSRGLFSKITGIQAVPETLIIDKKGNVVMRFRGNLQDFSINEIRDFLKNKNLENF